MDASQNLQAAVNDVGQRARAAGYEPNRAIERVAYGSFVSPAHRYLYVETPKAACTSFKHLIATIEGLPASATTIPHQRETRPDMLVHQRRAFAMPTLLDVDPGTRSAVFTRAPGWMIFALVRNPFSRLVSFFENKVRLGEPGYRRLEARYGDAARHGGLKESFGAFVREVVNDPQSLRGDSHLLPQSEVIMPRLIPYTHVFRLEAADEAVTALKTHLGGAALPPLLHNRSAGRDWRDYYDEKAADSVAKAYAEDFALFGYDAADWRARTDAPQAHATDSDYWRAEVVARNAMLDHLYSQLGVPPAANPADMRLRVDGDGIP